MWAEAMRAIQDDLPYEDFVTARPATRGQNQVEVPDVAGMSDAARPRERLAGRVLRQHPATRRDPPRAPTGTVAETESPRAGESAARRRVDGVSSTAVGRLSRASEAQAPASCARTSAATTPPSARPLTFGVSAPITRPIARMPVVAHAELVDRRGDQRGDLLLGELLGQVARDHRRLRALLVGLLVAPGVVERLGGLAPLLGLAAEHAEDVVVGELAASLPATSALVTAVSTIRRVEERTSSRALIEVVRSVRRRSFRSLMVAIVAALRHALPLGFRPAPAALRALGCTVGLGALAGLGTLAYAAGIEVRNFTVRRVEVPCCPPGTGRCGCCTSATCT